MFTYKNGWTTSQRHETYPPETNLSGNIAFQWMDNDVFSQDFWKDGVIYLDCGPETSDGALSDYYNVDEQLTKLLPFADISQCENCHFINRPRLEKVMGRQNATYEEAIHFIEEILTKAGCIKSNFRGD